MATKPKKTKRSPADLTSRNNNARKKDIKDLWKALEIIDALNSDLSQRVCALEDWKLKMAKRVK